MAILNYTTKIAAEKTIAQIQTMLIKHHAQAVMAECESGVVTRISFRINTPHGLMAFRLPADVNGVFLQMKKDKTVQNYYKTTQQATRVAWRIVKDWIEAQMAIIEAGMATLEQVFLPYAQTNSGETLYEKFHKHGFPAITYEASHEKSE